MYPYGWSSFSEPSLDGHAVTGYSIDNWSKLSTSSLQRPVESAFKAKYQYCKVPKLCFSSLISL